MSTFPWGRAGLVAGTLFAIVGAVFLSRGAKDVPAEVTVAPVKVAPVEVAPVEIAPVNVAPVEVAPDHAIAVEQFGDVPWPPGERRETSSSSSQGQYMQAGDSPMRSDVAERFFAEALAPCAPHRMVLGKSVSLVCETALEERRAMIVPRAGQGADDGTWLRASRSRFPAPDEAAPRDQGAPAGSCGPTLGYVALPRGARVSSSGGGDDNGQCDFTVPSDGQRVFTMMMANVFRKTTVVETRELIGDGIVRRSAEGWDEGWWRIDVVSAGDQPLARVTLTRWAPGEASWMSVPTGGADAVSCMSECVDIDRGRDPALAESAECRARKERCYFAARHGHRHPPAVLEP